MTETMIASPDEPDDMARLRARVEALEVELAHAYWHCWYLWKEADEEPHRKSFLAHLFKVRLPRHHINSALPQTRLMALEPHWAGDADDCCQTDADAIKAMGVPK